MTQPAFVHRASRIAAPAVALMCSMPAMAVDLTVSAVQINQGVQFGATSLVANNTTIVRVTVSTNGGGVIAGVDAALRMSVNNVPVAGPPIFSINGPITAPAAPNLANQNDTLNFMILAPVSNDVDFTVEVNPNRNVVETDYANNTFTVTNRVFLCKEIIELPYVPINYTFNGAGLPAENLMEPGIGDGFLRGIYTTEWNYHKIATPPLTWSQDINSSTSALHNTLNSTRFAMSPVPPFIYGWLPGNPYSGNGQAGGIPGTTAFGNTELTRFQRTFAHEFGHCIGLQHNSVTVGTVGFDEEHHLKDTQNLPQIHASSQSDVMVAGLLTNQAWVASGSYNQLLNHAAAQCATGDDEGDGTVPMPMLAISGVIMHDTRAVTLDPVTRFRRGILTENNPNGDIRIDAVNAAGNTIWSRAFRTDTARESCEPDARGNPVLSEHGPFFVMFPETVAGEAVHEIRVIDVATGNLLSSRVRSANVPQVAITAIEPLKRQPQNDGGAKSDRIAGRVRINWSASDADGDTLTHTLTYTPDNGATWSAVVVNTNATSVEFDTADLPTSSGASGRFSLVSTDGLNTSESDEGGIALGEANPPRTFLLTPNNTNVFPRYAPIAFHGTSWDPEDRLLNGASMVWTSSLDGQIGSGRLFIKSDLSVGTHVITLTGTDSANMSSFRQITITISPRTVISPDCNNNFVLDLVDIQNGTSQDLNGNGIPDECESTPCPSDIAGGDGQVDVNDLLAVITTWGSCPGCPPAHCAADIVPLGPPQGDCQIDVNDLLAVISTWGACP